MQHLQAMKLDYDDLPFGWALARMVDPELGLDAWQEMGESLIDGGGGLIGVQTPDRTLHGLATYEIVERRLFGTMLQVGTFVALELTGNGNTRRTLMSALREIAEASGCFGTIISQCAQRKSRS